MKIVAFYPKGILAPISLLAVMIPAGEITYEMWIEALSDRVLEMLANESNQEKIAEWACRELDCPKCIDPSQLGNYLVKTNLNFQTWINNSIINEPFDAITTDDDLQALKAIQSTNLKKWVRQAKKLMTGEAIEDYIKSTRFEIESETKVAYCPEEISAPRGLISAMVSIGEVTYQTWTNALADRISEMVAKEECPIKSCLDACEILEIEPCNNPAKLGKHIFENNLFFLTWIRSSLKGGTSFRYKVTKEDLDAKIAIENTNFATWLELVQKCTTGNNPEYFQNVYKMVEKEHRDKVLEPLIDADLKPYVDFIKKHLQSRLNCSEGYDTDCQIESSLYKFDYSISHHEGKVILQYLTIHNEKVKYTSLDDLNGLITKFNDCRKSKITYTHNVEKKWYFPITFYKPIFYFLTLERPLSNDVKIINETITDFYSDIFSFYDKCLFEVFFPKAKIDQDNDYSFLMYLQDEITKLDIIKHYSSSPIIADNDL